MLAFSQEGSLANTVIEIRVATRRTNQLAVRLFKICSLCPVNGRLHVDMLLSLKLKCFMVATKRSSV